MVKDLINHHLVPVFSTLVSCVDLGLFENEPESGGIVSILLRVLCWSIGIKEGSGHVQVELPAYA